MPVYHVFGSIFTRTENALFHPAGKTRWDDSMQKLQRWLCLKLDYFANWFYRYRPDLDQLPTSPNTSPTSSGEAPGLYWRVLWLVTDLKWSVSRLGIGAVDCRTSGVQKAETRGLPHLERLAKIPQKTRKLPQKPANSRKSWYLVVLGNSRSFANPTFWHVICANSKLSWP